MINTNTSHSFILRKLTLSFGFIIVSAVYAEWQNFNNQRSAISLAQELKNADDAFLQTLAQIARTASTTSLSVKNQTAPVLKSANSTQITVPAPQKPVGRYVDGSYTGNSADAYYGIVQIKIAVQNGRLAGVQFLQYPSDRDTSRFINSQAMPLLTQEAIQAQSAQVDGVSGATDTSQAFVQSLASALSRAKS
ncbi:MAG: FMN-binding protein [Minisyncoccota bacterium]